MAAKITTEPFGSIPPHQRHAITIHLPTWDTMMRFANRDLEVIKQFKNFYPRILLHKDVKELVSKILECAGVEPEEGKTCILFTHPALATACTAFATSPQCGEDPAPLSMDELSIRVFETDGDFRLWAVFFPVAKTPRVMPYWMHSGNAISSRVAEVCLQHIESLRELPSDSPDKEVRKGAAHGKLRERIAGLIERASAGPVREKKVDKGDVYLFKTGMTAIWAPHQYLLSSDRFKGTTILFGFAFHSTIHVFECWGPGVKFFGRGDAEDLDALEVFLEEEKKEGRKVQALWTEFPANPLLTSPDLTRLRKLADEYDFVLAVDDTIGSFCNVDVLGEADIVVTSLTKSFSGYADVMAGSVVLNPSSGKYSELKPLFEKNYVNDFYIGDAEALEENSRDYMSRSTILNNNAEKLVEYLQNLTSDPKSSVTKLYYPSVNPTASNYQACMRRKNADFTPGYGCLFSVEFDTVEQAKAFYDNLNVHQGPHLGAHLTLAIPYAKALYIKELDKIAPYGMKETQIRIAVGLEETEVLLEEFIIALKKADELKVQNVVSEVGDEGFIG